MLSAYTGNGKFWLTLGAAALVVDAAIAFQYGLSLTPLHALGFALVAIFFAFLPDAAYREYEARRWLSGTAMTLLIIPLGTVAFYSHLGYGAGVRLGDIQQTHVTNARYDDTRQSLLSDRTNIDVWRKQLSDLMEQSAWAATTKADALRAQVATAEKAIELESARRGCKAKCEAKMRERDDLLERIAKVERVEDLSKRIEATQRIIDAKTEKVAGATYAVSPVVNQNEVAGQLYLTLAGAEPKAAIAPDAIVTSFANLAIAGGGSLAFLLMAPVAFFLAGRARRGLAVSDKPTSAQPVSHFSSSLSPASTPRTLVVESRDELARALAELLRTVGPNLKGLPA